MACYGLTDGWFGHNDGPLRASEIPSNGELHRMFADTEEAVALSAWEPGAGDARPLQWPEPHLGEESVIFESALKDD